MKKPAKKMSDAMPMPFAMPMKKKAMKKGMTKKKK
jgi:hypothetical protein